MALDNGQNRRVLMASEMFVEYAGTMKRAELKQLEAMKAAIEQPVSMQEKPVITNIDYDGADYLEHVEKRAGDEYDILKEALDEMAASDKLYGIEMPKSDIEIGLVGDVGGFDYSFDINDTECPRDKSDDMYKAPAVEPAKVENTEEPTEEPVKEITNDEVAEAEKALGLDTNIFYILQKMANKA